MGDPRLVRDPAAAAEADYDLIVVGGGIYGVCATLEAARRGLSVLLLEQSDFGSGTSFNSLRILHGGLRYLQNMELRRFRESVGERRWFMAHFPELCRPLRCLMPLYNQGLRRPSVFRVALAMNDCFSADRNRGLREDIHLPRGKVLSRAETIEAFPQVDAQGLTGTGLWYDGLILSSERLQMELHRWAASCGAAQLNYVQAVGLIQSDGKVAGVEAVDTVTGQRHEYRSTKVLSCAGGWCTSVARAMGVRDEGLYPRSLAFNLLLDIPPVSDAAVAVEPKHPGARTYFLVPWKGRQHVGTYHMAWDGRDPDDRTPPQEAIETFLADLNKAVPGLGVSLDKVMHIYAGQLPSMGPGEAEMSHVAIFRDHGNGLCSLAGHKYTTARREVLKALDHLFAGRQLPVLPGHERPQPFGVQELADVDALIGRADVASILRRLADEEAVMHPNDLLLRRLDGVGSPETVAVLRGQVDAMGDPQAGVTHAIGGAA